MVISKSQIVKAESAKNEHVRLLNKELSYSEDLQDLERISRIRANIAKIDKMIAEAV